MHWMLVILISTGGGQTYFEEFPVFQTHDECTAVIAAWMRVPVDYGHIAGAACEPNKGVEI